METISIPIDESCKMCKRGLGYLKKLYKQDKNNYMGIKLFPVVKKDEDLVKRVIKGLILTPNYNSEGHLIHFHIRKEDE